MDRDKITTYQKNKEQLVKAKTLARYYKNKKKQITTTMAERNSINGGRNFDLYLRFMFSPPP